MKNKRIITLIVISFILPIFGYDLAIDMEDNYNPRFAILIFAIMSFMGLLSLLLAHYISLKTYGYKVIGYISLLLSYCLIASLGWIANGAWYNYYFFSDYVQPNYAVTQDSEHSNQFLFKGEFDTGAADSVIRSIFRSDNVDWNNPIVLELHSIGGRPQEAILLAEFVKHYNIHIEVIGQCISACSFVLLSSENRFVHPRAWIGLHATYIKYDNNEPNFDAPQLKYYDEKKKKILQKIGASEEFYKKTLIQDSQTAFFPTYQEIEESGITNQKERVYLPYNHFPDYL